MSKQEECPECEGAEEVYWRGQGENLEGRPCSTCGGIAWSAWRLKVEQQHKKLYGYWDYDGNC